MGCLSGTCTGYELRADLDFDTDGDGATYSGTGNSASSDSGDACHNNGSGWEPIGTFAATFKGNGHAISNLFIKRSPSGFVDIGLFGRISSAARIESVGLVDVFVHGAAWTGGLDGVSGGTVAAGCVTGSVRVNTQTGGGLV